MNSFTFAVQHPVTTFTVQHPVTTFTVQHPVTYLLGVVNFELNISFMLAKVSRQQILSIMEAIIFIWKMQLTELPEKMT